MSIQALGYLGIGTGKLDDWTNYAQSACSHRSRCRASAFRHG
jgi:hypothetical protein